MPGLANEEKSDGCCDSQSDFFMPSSSTTNAFTIVFLSGTTGSLSRQQLPDQLALPEGLPHHRTSSALAKINTARSSNRSRAFGH
jgi:hypothetical protein